LLAPCIPFEWSHNQAFGGANEFATRNAEPPMNPQSEFSRREMLKAAAVAGVAGSIGIQQLEAAPALADLIRAENEKPGTREWIATSVRIDPKTKYRSPWIEGYASRTSARAGESISLQVSTNPASSFVIDLYRLGFYQGLGARHIQQLGPFRGS